MKILLVNYEYPPVGGGAANATQEIARSLVQLGHMVSVVTGSFNDDRGERQESGIRLIRLHVRRRRADRSNLLEMFIFSVAAALTFVRNRHRYAEFDGSIIFFGFPCGPLGLILNWACGLRYVVALRGGDVPGFIPQLNWLHTILRPVRRTVYKKAIATVANSQGLRRLSRAADPTPIVVIPNGVDTEKFNSCSNKKSSNQIRILFVGRLHEQKNVQLLLEAYSLMDRKILKNTRLMLVGDGPLKHKLQQKAKNLGVSDKVDWMGWVDKSQLQKLYQSADFLVNPSFFEGMSYVVLEAMASGIPVIASDVAGNNEVVVHGETGFLFLLSESDNFVEYLNRLATNQSLRDQMGHAARVLVQENYSWRSVARQFIELFD